MAHDKLKALLDSGILQKITADKATYDKVVNGTAADVQAFAKSINVDLSDEAAAVALDQIKKMGEASAMLDVPDAGKGCGTDVMSRWRKIWKSS